MGFLWPPQNSQTWETTQADYKHQRQSNVCLSKHLVSILAPLRKNSYTVNYIKVDNTGATPQIGPNLYNETTLQ